jgi:hypothetical protein
MLPEEVYFRLVKPNIFKTLFPFAISALARTVLEHISSRYITKSMLVCCTVQDAFFWSTWIAILSAGTTLFYFRSLAVG